MILAVDGGLASCGWAVVRPGTGKLRDLGVIMQPRDPDLGEHEDRRRRVAVQSARLLFVAQHYRCTTIAAEEMSFGGPPSARLKMAVSQGLSWGALIAVASMIGARSIAVPPKTWQGAIIEGRAVEYDVLERKLLEHVGDHRSLKVIAKRDRNHALDAYGIGVFTALRHTGGPP